MNILSLSTVCFTLIIQTTYRVYRRILEGTEMVDLHYENI